MIRTVSLLWALCVGWIVNMARDFSSLCGLLVVLRGCDPLLYQYFDGGGFFTTHGQPNKQVRQVWYIYAQRYLDHHDEEFIRLRERVRRQFLLTSALRGLEALSLIACIIWH
ncbi:universal stress protein UspB [Salmonella enterica]|uniref:universal stress protein UspB n=1 Tax=Salmonella enterica TaxID=28901 RepID=UPI00398C2D4B